MNGDIYLSLFRFPLFHFRLKVLPYFLNLVKEYRSLEAVRKIKVTGKQAGKRERGEDDRRKEDGKEDDKREKEGKRGAGGERKQGGEQTEKLEGKRVGDEREGKEEEKGDKEGFSSRRVDD